MSIRFTNKSYKKDENIDQAKPLPILKSNKKQTPSIDQFSYIDFIEKINDLYAQLDELHLNGIEINKEIMAKTQQLEESRKSVSETELELISLQNRINIINESKKNIKDSLAKERSKISENDYQPMYNNISPPANKYELSPIDTGNRQVVEYRNSLLSHMNKSISNPWYDIFLYVFSYTPTDKSIPHAINFITNVPNMLICKGISQNVKDWLNKNKNLLHISVNERHEFLDYVINIRNMINILKGENQVNKSYIFKEFDISL